MDMLWIIRNSDNFEEEKFINQWINGFKPFANKLGAYIIFVIIVVVFFGFIIEVSGKAASPDPCELVFGEKMHRRHSQWKRNIKNAKTSGYAIDCKMGHR